MENASDLRVGIRRRGLERLMKEERFHEWLGEDWSRSTRLDDRERVEGEAWHIHWQVALYVKLRPRDMIKKVNVEGGRCRRETDRSSGRLDVVAKREKHRERVGFNFPRPRQTTITTIQHV